MPRSEPSRHPVSAAAPPAGGPVKVHLRRDEQGRLVIVAPDAPTTASVEAAERPPVPGDPRSGPLRDVPPFGAL
jgi:hypothetical protein